MCSQRQNQHGRAKQLAVKSVEVVVGTALTLIGVPILLCLHKLLDRNYDNYGPPPLRRRAKYSRLLCYFTAPLSHRMRDLRSAYAVGKETQRHVPLLLGLPPEILRQICSYVNVSDEKLQVIQSSNRLLWKQWDDLVYKFVDSEGSLSSALVSCRPM